jgi:hypothetical protein
MIKKINCRLKIFEKCHSCLTDFLHRSAKAGNSSSEKPSKLSPSLDNEKSKIPKTVHRFEAKVPFEE